MTVIATDGVDVEPRTVDAIVSYGGERYDFVINANASSGGEFAGLLESLLCNVFTLIRYVLHESQRNGTLRGLGKLVDSAVCDSLL